MGQLVIEANVTSFTCTTAAPEECCNLVTAGQGDLAYQFCLGICVLCCETCEIKWDNEGAESQWALDFPQEVPSRDFGDFQPTFGGVSFTTSTYGAFLPIVFGSDKLTGNVFWTSGFDNHEFTGADGLAYYYTTTNFALGICEGEINGVLRMWLGDMLIMDNTANVDESDIVQPNADGFIAGGTVNLTDRDSPLRQLSAEEQTTVITVFAGTTTQLPEGIISDVETYELTPGYRGVSYVLFENFVVTNSSIPNMFVEITANTQDLYPRLTGTLENNDTFTSIYHSYPIAVDPSYGRVYVYATGDGTTTPVSGRGIAVFDADTLEHIQDIEMEVTEGQTADAYEGFWVTTKGDLVFKDDAGNGSEIFTMNPFSGKISPVIGSINANDQITDPSLNSYGWKALTGMWCHLFYGTGARGTPTDIFVTQGQLSKTIGFNEIDPITGHITPVSMFSGYFPDNTTRLTDSVLVSATAAATTPFFPDGVTPTQGHHVMVFSPEPDNSGMRVWRFTVNSATVRLSAPVAAQMTSIDADEFGGAFHGITLEKVIFDETDGTFILFIGRSTVADRIIKWHPLTGEVMWSKALPDSREIHGFEGSSVGFIKTGQFALFANASFSGPIVKVNTLNGDMINIVESTSDQNLATHQFHGSWYNGYDNSLYYLSGDSGENITKVFLERITRSTVELSDIVRSLLGRVNYQTTDLDVSDLDTLTLRGYTVSRITSLRAIFSELQQVFKFDVLESNGRLLMKARGDAAVRTIPEVDLHDFQEHGWFEETQTNDFSRKRKINLTYRDIDREYLANVQTVILPKIDNSVFDEDAGIDVTVPIVLNANEAKALAEILLYAKNVYNSTYRGELGAQHIDLDPGDVVEIDFEDGRSTEMRLRETTIGTDRTMKFIGVKEDSDIYNDNVNLFGETGRFEDPTLPRGAPRIDPYFLNISFPNDVDAAATTNNYFYYLTFLNSNTSDVLTSDITVRFNGTHTAVIPAPTGLPTWGYVTNPIGATTSWWSTDYINTMQVLMMGESGASLVDYTNDQLIADDQLNLCYVGGELIQFETVVADGDGLYTFSGLNRALFGTDQFLNSHAYGERFIMIDAASIARIPVPTGTFSSPKVAGQVFVNNRNPYQPPFIQYMIANNLRPFPVNNLTAAYNVDDAEIEWTWRPRYGTDTLEEIELLGPVNVERLTQFEIWLYTDPTSFDPYNADTYLRQATVTDPAYIYTDAMQTTDAFDNTVDTLYYLVSQSGGNADDLGAGAQHALDPK